MVSSLLEPHGLPPTHPRSTRSTGSRKEDGGICGVYPGWYRVVYTQGVYIAQYTSLGVYIAQYTSLGVYWPPIPRCVLVSHTQVCTGRPVLHGCYWPSHATRVLLAVLSP